MFLLALRERRNRGKKNKEQERERKENCVMRGESDPPGEALAFSSVFAFWQD